MYSDIVAMTIKKDSPVPPIIAFLSFLYSYTRSPIQIMGNARMDNDSMFVEVTKSSI